MLEVITSVEKQVALNKLLCVDKQNSTNGNAHTRTKTCTQELEEESI